jgi:AraC-like DNA-binding protein
MPNDVLAESAPSQIGLAREGSLASMHRTSVASRDVDEALDVAARLYYPLSIKLHDGVDRFGIELEALQCGPMTMGLLSFASEVECITDILDAYEVNVPITGKMLSSSGSERIVATRSVAAVCRADRNSMIRVRRGEPCQMLVIKIERSALENHLEQLIGSPVRNPIAFDLALDLTSGPGRQWRAVAGLLATQAFDGDSIFQHPLLAAAMTQSFMLGLLLAGQHNYSDSISGAASSQRAAPAAISRAREYIEAHLDEPLGAMDIARACGISLRALQQGFHSSLQTTPMRYLRELRLRKVHEDLIAADHDETGVAEIAHRWGFGHLGRFAAHYRDMYGQCPSAALRSG